MSGNNHANEISEAQTLRLLVEWSIISSLKEG
jgi:hypothetical protein